MSNKKITLIQFNTEVNKNNVNTTDKEQVFCIITTYKFLYSESYGVALRIFKHEDGQNEDLSEILCSPNEFEQLSKIMNLGENQDSMDMLVKEERYKQYGQWKNESICQDSISVDIINSDITSTLNGFMEQFKDIVDNIKNIEVQLEEEKSKR